MSAIRSSLKLPRNPIIPSSSVTFHQRLSWTATPRFQKQHQNQGIRFGKMDYSTLKAPENCYADFCLLPLGTGSASVSQEIAAVQRLIRSSGLKYHMHSAGTTVEGPWDEVMGIIGKAHALVHQGGVHRIQTSMRVGSRTDKVQYFEDKVRKVEEILAEDEKK